MTQPAGSERTSTAHSRELGAHLRLIRHRSDIRFKELLETLEWSAGKLSKLERGTRGTSREDIFYLLGACGADKATREQVATLVDTPDHGGFLRLHDRSPDSLLGLRQDEEEATTVTSYDPVGIPALVQTDDYTRALTDDEEIVTARLERRRRLAASSRRRVTLFLREAALGTVVGSTQVMRDQLLHLTLLSGTPTTVIRVIPQHQGLCAALHHPATLLTLDAPARPVVYVETYAATAFHDDPEVVATYRSKFRQLGQLALDPAESRTLLVHWTNRHDTKAS